MNSHSVQVVAAEVAQRREQLGRRDRLSGCWSPPAPTPRPLPPGQDCEHWHERRADPLADGDGGSLNRESPIQGKRVLCRLVTEQALRRGLSLTW
ncbi:MAG: hypothetical protein ACK587_12385 [Cyanobacteriota bacterium]